MTQAHDPAIAVAQKKLEPACELAAGCELVAQMRRTLDVLEQANQEMQLALAELDHLAGTDKLTGAWNRRRLKLERDGAPRSLPPMITAIPTTELRRGASPRTHPNFCQAL
jgi:hypothetical protein